MEWRSSCQLGLVRMVCKGCMPCHQGEKHDRGHRQIVGTATCAGCTCGVRVGAVDQAANLQQIALCIRPTRVYEPCSRILRQHKLLVCFTNDTD